LDLGVALEEYPLTSQGMIGTEALPIFPTPLREGQFSTITRESILRTRNVNRGANGAYSRDSFDTDLLEYACKERGHESPLGEDQAKYYASMFDAEMVAAAIARDVILKEQEKRIAAALFNTTTFTGASLFTDLSKDWDDATALIVDDVEGAKEKVRTNCGVPANTMIISASVLPWLKKNTDLKGRLQYVQALTDRAIVDQLGALFGLQKVLVAGGIYNSADEGLTASLSDIWSDNYCWVGVTATTQSLAEPCIGRTMLWTADSPSNVTVESYPEPQTRANVYRVRHHVDEKIFDPYFGHLLQIDT
jgi:hypothetical protein